MGRVQNYINSHTTKQKPYDGGGLCCNTNSLLSSSESINPLGLKLSWNDINNTPVTAGDVSEWNSLFNLPANGSPFTSVEVSGNDVYLIGGSGITIATGLFANDDNLTLIDDQALCIVRIDHDAFDECNSLTDATLNACITFGAKAFGLCDTLQTFTANAAITFGNLCFASSSLLLTINAPNATTIADNCFRDMVNLTELTLPSCTALGSTVGNNSVFDGISGNNFTLTIPAALMTCNAGNPDGDIQYLQAHNTVTIIQV